MSKIITQSDYTRTLISKRNDLADNIDTKGVEAERTEKLNSLVPKVLEIGGGGSSRLDETKINVMREGDPKLYTFATIADAKTFINATDIHKHVYIGANAGITSIDVSTFRDCTSLKSIYIPDSVNTIGNYAFWGCTSLESIIIPDSVNTIGSRAFLSCTSLTSIDLPDSITAIDSGVFYDCTSLISINIPYTVTEIGSEAFRNCTSLTSIDINNDGNNSISIGDYTFANCTSLTDIHLYDAGTTVGKYAFQNCTSLKNIYIYGLENIGEGAFENCTSLTGNTDSSSIDGIGIGANAFKNCMSLTSISMEYVGSVGASAFENCKSLTDINISQDSELTSISVNAFKGCTSLTSITIPNNVTSIANNAFANCTSLTDISLPSSVTSIGSNAFEGCDILLLDSYKTRTGYPWGATSILIHNEDVATTVNSSSTDRQVPTAKAVYDALSSSGGSIDDTKINVMREGDPELYIFATIANAKTFINSTSTPKHVIIGSNAGITSIGAYAFEHCASLVSIHIPDSVTSIKTCAFKDCSSLTFIDIPDNVTQIDDYAFRNCASLVDVTIPSGITIISAGLFNSCASLEHITIPSGVTSIGNSAFSSCTSLKSIAIPNSVTTIYAQAFFNCISLKSIAIPNSVTTIASNVFERCDILLLENYKSRTGYPWGATDILIHNEYVTTTIDANNTDRQVPTAKAVYTAISDSTVDAYTKAQTDALLDGKADLVDGKIPASELPSYVDDVLEYASTSAFPATGEAGKIYVATDTNKTYRWSGTGYTEISQSLALGETSSTAYAGNKGKANADAIAAIKDGTNLDSFSDVETALGNKADKSTTYTKTEVDSALATKQNTLTTAQLAAVNSGIDSTKVAQIETNKNNILFNARNGVANMTDISDITLSSDGYLANRVKFNAPAGTYRLKSTISGGTAKYTVVARMGDTEVYRADSAIGTPDIDHTFTLSVDADSISIWVQLQSETSVSISNTMVYPAALGDISYHPYALSNAELTQSVEPIPRLVDAGAKNLLNLVTPSNIRKTTITDDENGSVIASCNNATWANTGYEFNLTVGKAYKFIIYVDSASVSDVQFQCFIADTSGSEVQELGRTSRITSSGVYSIDFVATSKNRVSINLNNSATAASGSATYHAMLCTAEDYAISPEFVPYAKSNYELTQVTESIPRLVDAGAKNIASITTPPNRPDLNIQVVDGHVSISGTLSGTITWWVVNFGDGFVCKTDMVIAGAQTRTGIIYNCGYVDKTGTAHYAPIPDNNILIVPAGSTIRYLYVQQNATGTSISLEADVMVCTLEDYAISPEFVPYAPSNRELYEMILALQNG